MTGPEGFPQDTFESLNEAIQDHFNTDQGAIQIDDPKLIDLVTRMQKLSEADPVGFESFKAEQRRQADRGEKYYGAPSFDHPGA